MKQLKYAFEFKTLLTSALFCFYSQIIRAQENNTVQITEESIGNWLTDNWLWIAGGLVLLLVIIGIISSSGTVKKKTTIVREEGPDGVIRTTTTEIKE